MVVVDDAAVRADGDVDARFLKILIALSTDIDERSCLPAADPLCLTRDADRAPADADLDKICPRVCEEAEALAVDDVARTDLDCIAVLLTDVLDGQALPLGEPLRGVNAEHIDARLDERRHALGIVTRVDARADDVALVVIGQFKFILLVVGVVLTEHHVAEALILVDEREHIKLALPDEIVCLRESRCVCICPDEFFEWCHEGADLRIERHT